ncbi:MAG: hypothetical protein R3B93_27620 [Bacteroidia bacterium]
MAIEADLTWKEKTPHAGIGMKAVRSFALLSYRNYAAYVSTQSENNPDVYNDLHRPSCYQRYQGEKLAKDFMPFAYWTLSKQWILIM